MYRLTKAEKALADETRLRIVNLLLERECCVCEVMQALGISQTRASRNLGMLYDAGLLKLRREGLWSLYSIDEEGEFAPLVAGLRSRLETNGLARADRERLKRAKRLGPLADHRGARQRDCAAPSGRTPESGDLCL